MDTQETKATGFTPMQSMQLKIDKLSLSIDWLKWNLAIGFPVLFAGLIGLASLVFFLFSRLETNTRQDIQKLESRIDRIDSRIDKLESSIQDIRILLIQNTGRQDTKQASPAKRQAKR